VSDPAIVAEGLTKRYGDERAVSDLSLSIPAGSVYGFLGPNGAGKTTTMRLLTTLTEPSAGRAEVAGVSVTDRPALTERVGYLPADPPVFDELTGWEQLRHVARLHGIPDAEADERIERLLDRFDLLGDADRRIESYSTGMTKKVGVVGAVLHEPAVVLLDEPTSGLDPRAARTVREMVAELASGETTVFLSTHVLPVADELADTVGVIDDGRLVAEGTPGELKARSVDAADGGADLESVFMDVTTDERTSGSEEDSPAGDERPGEGDERVADLSAESP
jgi:ABC-2 type transport system ATP-binding protein